MSLVYIFLLVKDSSKICICVDIFNNSKEKIGLMRCVCMFLLIKDIFRFQQSFWTRNPTGMLFTSRFTGQTKRSQSVKKKNISFLNRNCNYFHSFTFPNFLLPPFFWQEGTSNANIFFRRIKGYRRKRHPRTEISSRTRCFDTGFPRSIPWNRRRVLRAFHDRNKAKKYFQSHVCRPQ